MPQSGDKFSTTHEFARRDLGKLLKIPKLNLTQGPGEDDFIKPPFEVTLGRPDGFESSHAVNFVHTPGS